MARSKKPQLSREERLRLQEEDVRLSCLIIDRVRRPNGEACAAMLVAGGYEADDLTESELLDSVETLECLEERFEEMLEEEMFF